MIGLNFSKLMLKKNNSCDYFFSELDIDFNHFKELWIGALKKRSDFRALFLFLNQFIQHLDFLLQNKKTHTYVLSILKMVNKKNIDKAIQKLNAWVEDKNVISELQYLIIKRLHKIKKIPYQGSPRMCFYYFTKDLKYEIVKQINKFKPFFNPKVDTTCYYEMEIDIIKNFDSWEKYLSRLYLMGYNKKEISEITNLSRQTIYIEEKKLCLYLKKKQLKI